jgi:hypothetical protein
MSRALLGAAALPLVLALASASAGASASGARPPVALTASPSKLELPGTSQATVRVTNGGASRVVLDVGEAGFALDLRGRPRVVAQRASQRSAADWLAFRPRRLVLRPGASGSVMVASKVPARAEPGDHDALVLFTTRRLAADGLSVRIRMGVVVVVRAPGQIVRGIRARGLRVVRRGRARTLELSLVNRGNVTESFLRARALVSFERDGRRLARVRGEARELRPRTRGVLEFRYRGSMSGRVIAHVDVGSESGQVVRRAFRIRL